MLGPFNLRYIHLFVDDGAVGAFILSRKGRSADFVGLSPDDLARSLSLHRARFDYRYFWFSYADSPEKASALANDWYHRYHPTDNAVSPVDPPPPAWRCTVAGCTACALARQKN